MISNSQLQKLGDRLRKGTSTEADLQILDEHRASFAGALNHVDGALRELGYAPNWREKTRDSIIRKLERERTNLSRMQDILGCRLIVDGLVAQDACVSQVNGRLAILRVDDRRSDPKHGYRAVHIIAEHGSRVVEIQIRTELQDQWAQFSERLSVVYPGIKYGEGPLGVREPLLELSAHIKAIEVLLEDSKQNRTALVDLRYALQAMDAIFTKLIKGF